MEVYENHMGGIYFDDDVLSFDDLYCEQCGDSDWHLGHADTWDDVLEMLKWESSDNETNEYKYCQDYMDELKRKFEVYMNS